MPNGTPTPETRATKAALHRVSTTDAVVAVLTDQILSGQLEPGARLLEVDLAEQFGISRQSLRTALAELTHRGILHKEPYKGVWVPVLRPSDIEDLYYVRTIVETEAIRHLAHTPRNWPAARESLAHFDGLSSNASWSKVVEADIFFHKVVVDLVGSSRLSRLYEMYSVETGLGAVPARAYFSPTEMAQEHRLLLEVVESGNQTKAAKRFKQHLEWGLEQLLAAVER